MLFRQGYNGIYDQETLTKLQDILEFVWLAIIDDGQAGSVSREEIARMIFAAYARDLSPESIQRAVIRNLAH
jgi:hypothetical protein